MNKETKSSNEISVEDIGQIHSIINRGRKNILGALRRTISDGGRFSDHRLVSQLSIETIKLTKIFMDFKGGITTWKEFNEACNLVDQKILAHSGYLELPRKKEIIKIIGRLLEKIRNEMRDFLYSN